jgi:hypothetical protein
MLGVGKFAAREDGEGHPMSGIYAMRRANGDWFVFEGRGRLRVPLFRSSHDAMMASVRNSGMLLFRPVALDGALLKDMVPAGDARYVDFCMVKDPLVSLRRGKPLGQNDLVLLTNKSAEGSAVSHNGNSRQDSVHISPLQNEWWN